MQPSIRWHTAVPLWSATLDNGQHAQFKQPTILRFASDTFMEDLAAQLNGAPDKLLDYVAREETWRDNPASWSTKPVFSQDQAVKLYQPAHGRFYLIAASLVCRIPGLPDRTVNPANEQTFFLLRKVVPRPGFNTVDLADETTYDEYGWQNESWQFLTNRQQAASAEERLPLFSMAFRQNQQPRRLLAGLIPVARRETYQAAPGVSPEPTDGVSPAGNPAVDLLMDQFEVTVSNALKELAGVINDFITLSGPPPDLTAARAREVFVFALLDLGEFLQTHLPEVWQVLPSGTAAGVRGLIVNDLKKNLVGSISWAAALKDIIATESDIVTGKLNTTSLIIDPFITPAGASIPAQIAALQAIKNAIGTLNLAAGSAFFTNIKTILQSSANLSLPGDLENMRHLAQVETQGEATYVIRCVYERPCCLTALLAGSLKNQLGAEQRLEQIVSPPSPAFRLAPFFDPDAPVRPLRIAMPLDTSPEGLRQFPKNVSILLSDELQRQIERIQGSKLADLDEGKLNNDPGLTLGMICSFSIPIITICALILLMIIVQLLNIVFWWLPFFKICLPIPLKAKG